MQSVLLGERMKEVVIVPTFRREELLHCCLRRIRSFEGDIPIRVFPDRGTSYGHLVTTICDEFEAEQHIVPIHDSYGNTANVMDAYFWAYNNGYDRVFFVESDVMVHSDFFSWHREMQEEFPDIFCSMGWIFNREAPITDDLLFQPWYYSIGTCFSREKLKLIAKHATERYYSDMVGYLERNFEMPRNFSGVHWEQDGLIQRVLNQDKSQTVAPGIAKCSHVGAVRSYGDGTQRSYEEFFGLKDVPFLDRVKKVEEFIADPYARMAVFGRALVEREVGRVLPKQEFSYRLIFPGGWESTFKSELKLAALPKRRINSVPMTDEAKIVLE